MPHADHAHGSEAWTPSSLSHADSLSHAHERHFRHSSVTLHYGHVYPNSSCCDILPAAVQDDLYLPTCSHVATLFSSNTSSTADAAIVRPIIMERHDSKLSLPESMTTTTAPASLGTMTSSMAVKTSSPLRGPNAFGPTTSRRSSTTSPSTPKLTSPQSSRRPSVSRHHTVQKRPGLGSRRSTFSSSHQHQHQQQEDPYAVHARACALFSSTTATSASSRPNSQVFGSALTSQASLVSPGPIPHQGQAQSQGVAPHRRTSSRSDSTTIAATPVTPAVAPQTVIDWTDPVRRRNLYQQYDRDRRGVRGLWRRLTPDWACWRGSQLQFWDEGKEGQNCARRRRQQQQEQEQRAMRAAKNKDDGDTGSVRRFRLALDDEPEPQAAGDGDESITTDVEKVCPVVRSSPKGRGGKAKSKRSWSCFGKDRKKQE